MMRSRAGRVALVVLMLAVVNLPLMHSSWTRWRVARDGVEVTGSVTDTAPSAGDTGLVAFQLPSDVDPDRRTWTVRVAGPAYDEAQDTDQVRVRVVPGEPAAQRVTGQVSSRVGLAVALVADLILVGLLLLLWRRPGLTGPPAEGGSAP